MQHRLRPWREGPGLQLEDAVSDSHPVGAERHLTRRLRWKRESHPRRPFLERCPRIPSLRRKTGEGQAVKVSSFSIPEDCPHVLQVFGRVNARAAPPTGHGHLHLVAVLQDPELFERFRRRKGRGGQGGVSEQKLPAEAIDADMPVAGNARFNAWIGKDGPAEVQGAPDLSMTTFTTLGFLMDSGSARGSQRVDERACPSSERREAVSSIMTGSRKGSSPWMLITTSASSFSAASAARQVPLGWSGEVRTQLPPKLHTSCSIRSSSVATTRRWSIGEREARS